MKVSVKQYAQTLYELTSGKNEHDVRAVVADFVAQMKRNGHMKIARGVIAEFEKVYNNAHGIVVATVTSAFPLSDMQKASVEKYITMRYGARTVAVTYHGDEGIRGGIVIKVGDEVLDASVNGRLKALHRALTR